MAKVTAVHQETLVGLNEANETLSLLHYCRLHYGTVYCASECRREERFAVTLQSLSHR